MRNDDFIMDNGVATDIVLDTTISHNTDSKLLDNVILNNSHTTWTRSAKSIPFSNKCLCVTSYINDMKLEILMSDDTINVEHTLVKVSSQIPRSICVNIIYRNIRGLGNKSNELYYHLHHDLPHIVCLLEHHLSESELQSIHLSYYH